MASILCKWAPCNRVFPVRRGALAEVLPFSFWAIGVLVQVDDSATRGLGCNLVFLPQRSLRRAMDAVIEGRFVIIVAIGPVCGRKCERRCRKSLVPLALDRYCLQIELFFPLECCNLNVA